MRFIDLDNDILIEPKKKIIESSSELLTPSTNNIIMSSSENIEDEITRRKFLIYASGVIVGTIIPTKSNAFPLLPLLADGLILVAINILRNLIAQTIKIAVKEVAKKNAKTIFGLSKGAQNYVIDAVVDLISDYVGEKINKTFIRNALLKYDVLNTPIEAGWDIDRKNKLEVSFYNPTNQKISTKLEMYVYDVHNRERDNDSPSIKYVRNYYLELNKKSEIKSYELFAKLPKEGLKNIIFVGNESFKEVIVTKSKNIIVDTIII